MKYHHQLPDDSVNLPKENLLYLTLKLVLSLSAITIFVYFLISITVDLIASQISPQQEKRLMEFASVDINLSDSKSDYLTAITQKLQVCAKLPYDIDVYTLTSHEANAFALPGGTIYITTELLEKVESENELAFIIGHELGHFKNKDHIRGLGQSLLLTLLGMLIGDNYGTIISTPLQISQAKYSQSAELAADSFGLELLQCAYGGVKDATKFFEQMDDGEDWKYFLASHPDFGKRIKKIEALIKERGYDIHKDVLPLKKI